MHVHKVRVLYHFLDHMLKPLGDPEYQKRVWIDHKGPEVDDYDDATMYFMEKCEDIFSRPNDFEGLNYEVQKSLKVLYDRIREFDDEVADNIPEGKEYEIINTCEWQEIQILASATYREIINNLKERNYEYR